MRLVIEVRKCMRSNAHMHTHYPIPSCRACGSSQLILRVLNQTVCLGSLSKYTEHLPPLSLRLRLPNHPPSNLNLIYPERLQIHFHLAYKLEAILQIAAQSLLCRRQNTDDPPLICFVHSPLDEHRTGASTLVLRVGRQNFQDFCVYSY
jgi:hypothetical protein